MALVYTKIHQCLKSPLALKDPATSDSGGKVLMVQMVDHTFPHNQEVYRFFCILQSSAKGCRLLSISAVLAIMQQSSGHEAEASSLALSRNTRCTFVCDSNLAVCNNTDLF